MRIGELAAAAATTTQTIRYYEQVGLLPLPERTSGGYRDYDQIAVARLCFIRRCRAAGLSVRQIIDLLKVGAEAGQASTDIEMVLDQRLEALDRQLAQLLALREDLSKMLLHAAETRRWPEFARDQTRCKLSPPPDRQPDQQ